ncbi:hypothetical protein ACFQY5_40025 [Paeniroseomonas aquatica]|uniref:Uncharacterized protein n=1 Tax=Paeniroseomonas aquatica TaxID=373043 RepID=A0ABT8A063_9PROT|nr:hypothetical protein [Paeniroseomonas aquatica]MDN3563112.1 hypothetical protein [Paeniroseomonas aquatica]
MDKDLIAAFEGLNDGLTDSLVIVNQTMTTFGERQFEQGELLETIVKLLTPKPQEGPTTTEAIEKLVTVIEASATAQVAAIRELTRAVKAIPGETVALLAQRQSP